LTQQVSTLRALQALACQQVSLLVPALSCSALGTVEAEIGCDACGEAAG
jgi:hypothetical protein